MRYLVDSGSCGELIWMLHQVYDRNGSHKEWVLEIYDASADEYTVKRITHEQLGLEGGRLDGMNMIDKESYGSTDEKNGKRKRGQIWQERQR